MKTQQGPRRRRGIVPVAGFLTLAAVGFLAGTRSVTGVGRSPGGPSVLIDPGHGGFDGGCGGGRSPILEKTLNLAIGKHLARKLAAFGVAVPMTRTDDRHLGPTHRADLLARVRCAADVRADVVICIHADWSWNSSRSGSYTFYHHSSPGGRILAQSVQEELNRLTGTSGMALPARDLLVIREVGRPAVLVEVGFLSNDADRRRLADPIYQERVAEALSVGIIRYLLRGR